jgi:hypothetical protein
VAGLGSFEVPRGEAVTQHKSTEVGADDEVAARTDEVDRVVEGEEDPSLSWESDSAQQPEHTIGFNIYCLVEIRSVQNLRNWPLIPTDQSCTSELNLHTPLAQQR